MRSLECCACVPVAGNGEPWRVVEQGGDTVRTLNSQAPISASISHDARWMPALVQVTQLSTGERRPQARARCSSWAAGEGTPSQPTWQKTYSRVTLSLSCSLASARSHGNSDILAPPLAAQAARRSGLPSCPAEPAPIPTTLNTVTVTAQVGLRASLADGAGWEVPLPN